MVRRSLLVLSVFGVLFPLFAQTKNRTRSPKAPVKASAAKPPAPQPASVSQWLHSLTLEQQIAQLVMIPVYGDNPTSRSRFYRQTAALVRDTGVGGIIVVNRVSRGSVVHAEPHAAAAFLNRMQRLAKIPLLVGADFERGASMRIKGTTKFPHNMAFAAARDLEGSSEEGFAAAREARSLGIHWVFAPVADVNNNPDNPIINIRAYSESPKEVASHVAAYIRGVRSNSANPVLVTVKHFPGHGDTAVDSHLGMGKIEADLDRLQNVELEPFLAAIAAGVDSIMTAHLWVPALEPEEIPATVSPAILTGLLRRQLGFKGITVTDAMDMQGLSRRLPPGEAAVQAILAGADVLLMPPRPAVAIAAVAKAVQSGRISKARLEESVRKILEAKFRLGLHQKRLVNLEELTDNLESEDAGRTAARVARKAITLVKNDGPLLPLSNPDQSCWYVLSENRYGEQGRAMMDALSARLPKATRKLLDPAMSATEIEEAPSASCSSHIVAAFASPAAYQNSTGLHERYARLMELLAATGQPVALVSMGNPYLLRGYPQVAAYVAAFSTSPVSEEAVVAALSGAAAIEGVLPVSIPPLAKIGDGMQIPARPASAPLQ